MKYNSEGTVILTVEESVEILADAIKDMLHLRSETVLDRKELLRYVRLNYEQARRQAFIERRLTPPWAIANDRGKKSNTAV